MSLGSLSLYCWAFIVFNLIGATFSDNDPFRKKKLKISGITRGINVYGAYTEHGYSRCIQCRGTPGVHITNSNKRKTTTVPRRKRADGNQNFLHQEINVNQIVLQYEQEYPEHLLRQIDPHNIVDRNVRDPIVSYSTMPLPGVTARTQAFLPLVITSIITNYTRPAGKRKTIPTLVDTNFRNMDPVERRDEKCHIVAYRFNGPNEVYNIFPCTWDMNRGQGSQWEHLENAIASFVNQHADGYVEHTAVLSYDFDNAVRPMRPNAIGLRVRYYNNQHVLSDAHGVALGRRANPYENMYFNNDPDYCCSAELIED